MISETMKAFDKVFTRRRKRSSAAAMEDPDFVRPGLRRDEMPKHRSCKVHMLTHIYGKEASRKHAEQIEDEYGTAYCFFDRISHGLRSKKNNDADPVLVPLQETDMSSDPGPLQEMDMSSDPGPLQETDMSSDPGPLQDGPLQETDMSSDPGPLQETDISSSPVPLQATDISSVMVPFQATNMDSGSFSDHLEGLWRSFPADKLVDLTYLDCAWFGLYRKDSNRTKVLSWIKKENIFSRKYVFVPICCWSHWNLLILCHFGEPLDSDNKKPSMLLLDSLHLAGPMRLEKEIRKFVLDIYKAEGRSDEGVSRIPLTVPKVPQQRNKECGFFSLYFIKKFTEEAPETISDTGVPPFINQNWFERKEFDCFCIALEKESKERSQLEAMASEKTGQQESWKDGDVIVIGD